MNSQDDDRPLLESDSTTNNADDPRKKYLQTNKGWRAACPGRLGKSLTVVVSACMVITYKYWTQPTPDLTSSFRAETTNKEEIQTQRSQVEIAKDQKRVQWTWLCDDIACTRSAYSNSTIVQSLETCNMFCGSTKLWPLPTGRTNLSKRAVPVTTDKLSLKIDKSPSENVTEHIKDAFELFIDDLRKVELSAQSNKDAKHRVKTEDTYEVTVHVNIDGDGDPRLRLNTDESYNLSLKKDKNNLIVNITAHSFCGARNGFEILFQLIWMDPNVGSLLAFEQATIADAPKFKYRGLLLDTARNFFPVKDIMRMIDAMGANKLNTFHWHATDSQSFPLRLNSAPELALHGAYGPAAVYTPDDIRAIVRRARLRGIRVVIEVDAPAHVGSAFSYGPPAGFGDLAYCIELQPWPTYCDEPPCGQLNPQNVHIYDLLEKIYAEIIELTGVDDVFHIGGDEINANCWKKYKRNSNLDQLWFQFTQKSYEALERANGGKAPKLTMLWSSRFTKGSNLKLLNRTKYAIQLWGTSHRPDQLAILNTRYRSIVSHMNAWYLNCGVGSWRDASYDYCGLYHKWQEVYGHRPWSHKHYLWKIEGGVACQWTETLGPADLDTRLWPRGAALAERLWSDPTHNVTDDVYLRLDTQRSRMRVRGIGVDPLWPTWCTQNPTGCLDNTS